MATLARIRVTWTGSPVVGGGISTFYSSNSDPSAFCTALRTYFASVGASLAAGINIQVPGVGDTIEDTTGELNGSWSMSTPAVVTTSGSSNWAMGVGIRQTWLTSGITRGRRVKGTTFLVPLGGNLYDGTGSIADATVITLNAAATTLRGADSGSMRIFSRPSAPGASDGSSHAVIGNTAVDKVAWLKSRKN